MITTLIAATLTVAAPSPKALRFTADSHIVQVPYQSLMDVQELTLEAWIKLDESAKKRHFNYIFCRNYGGLGYGLAIHGKAEKVSARRQVTRCPSANGSTSPG